MLEDKGRRFSTDLDTATGAQWANEAGGAAQRASLAKTSGDHPVRAGRSDLARHQAPSGVDEHILGIRTSCDQHEESHHLLPRQLAALSPELGVSFDLPLDDGGKAEPAAKIEGKVVGVQSVLVGGHVGSSDGLE